MVTLEDIMKLFQFEPLPIEGGLFKRTYLSTETIPHTVFPARYIHDKPFGTAILYLVTDEPNSFRPSINWQRMKSTIFIWAIQWRCCNSTLMGAAHG